MPQRAPFSRNFLISLLILFSGCFFRFGDTFFLSNKNFLFFILVFLILSFLFKLYSHYLRRHQFFYLIVYMGLFIVAVMIISYVRAHWHTYFGVCFVGVYSLFGMGAPSTGGTGGMSCTYMMPSGSDASNGNGEWRGYLNDSPEGGDAVSDAENVPAAENPPGHPNEAAPAPPNCRSIHPCNGPMTRPICGNCFLILNWIKITKGRWSWRKGLPSK
ncbi:orf215 (mitochondrion) [Beta vulgaris subsp. vulgaris]|uniref:Orf215 protein n=1 Tax=Beta vulgaris subsp. vulgaris TaxID=3555 RepID=Q9MFB6_BETVV|nr:orf215 [Beta vulgaris subsp. vulgaris]BAA99326.1 orf215 [Beta vulgaris subsp. vulgaris]